MAFDNTKLSYFHSFSKMPAQNGTTLGNAINKSGHTVTASEVWSQDIPYYGKMGSLTDVVAKVQPYARKNDMCYITAGADKGKTFQYDGVSNWTDITSTLIDGALIKNSKDEVVLLYHKGQNLTNLTADNNANTDSANNAARLWASRAKDGSALPVGETRLIEQFVAPTDKALNGLASVAYAPVIANGSLVSGTGYYDYCFSGTILWATARTAVTPIDCFEYVGDKVSDVVDTVASHASTIAIHTSEISELKDKLGIEDDDTPGSDSTPTLGGRVTALEEAVETLNGDATTDGSIAKSIKDAIDGLGNVAVKDDIKITDIKVKQGSGEAESLTITDKSVTIEIPEVPAADVTETGVVTTDGFTKTADVTNLAKAAINAALADTAEGSLGDKIGDVESIANQAKTAADSAVQSVTRATGSSELITVTGGTDVTISLSTEVATKTDAANAASEAITSSLADTTTAGSIGKAIDDAKKDAIDNAKVTITQGTGITVTPNGTASTSFTVAVDDTIATAQSVTDVAGRVTSIENSLSGTGADTIGGKIAAAQKAAEDAQSAADSKVSSVTGPTTGLITVTGDKEVTITVSETIATKEEVSAAQSAAEGKVTALQDTEITQQSVSGAGITVTLDGTVGAPTLTGSVTTATYTKAVEDVDGSWSDETQVVTAGAVKSALADVDAKHTADIEKVEAAIESLSTSGFSREIVTELPTTDIKLNAIYLVANKESDANEYVEYIYVGGTVTDGQLSGGRFEQIGTTKTDLSEYVTNSSLATTLGGYTTTTEHSNLESTVSALSQVVADNKTAAENAITALDATPSGNGITVTQVDGVITAVAAAAGTVEENNTDVVTGGVVHAAITKAVSDQAALDADAYAVKDTETVAQTAQTTAEAKVQNITTEDARITLTPTTEDKVKSVEITLAETVATVDGSDDTSGTVYTKAQVDEKVAAAKPENYVTTVTVGETTTTGEVAVEIEAKTEATHFGSELISASLENSKVSIVAEPAGGWSYSVNHKPNSGISSVINGKMSDGSTIDDANLVNGYVDMTDGLFSDCTELTTYVGNLGRLENGQNMFAGCTKLETFIANLDSLVYAEGMFSGCKLSEESLMYIVDSLPINPNIGVATVPYVSAYHIDIDVAEGVVKAPYIEEALAKGWTLNQ